MNDNCAEMGWGKYMQTQVTLEMSGDYEVKKETAHRDSIVVNKVVFLGSRVRLPILKSL